MRRGGSRSGTLLKVSWLSGHSQAAQAPAAAGPTLTASLSESAWGITAAAPQARPPQAAAGEFLKVGGNFQERELATVTAATGTGEVLTPRPAPGRPGPGPGIIIALDRHWHLSGIMMAKVTVPAMFLGPLSQCLAPVGTINNAQARPLGAASRAAELGGGLWRAATVGKTRTGRLSSNEGRPWNTPFGERALGTLCTN